MPSVRLNPLLETDALNPKIQGHLSKFVASNLTLDGKESNTEREGGKYLRECEVIPTLLRKNLQAHLNIRPENASPGVVDLFFLFSF